MKPNPRISFDANNFATSAARSYAAYILNGYRHHPHYRATKIGNVYTFRGVHAAWGNVITVEVGRAMRTIEQLFTCYDKQGRVITTVWMPIVHGLSGEWLQTKLVRMTAAGCTVRVK